MSVGLDELLKEIGRVHLRGWEGYPRDESLDRVPRHSKYDCRKCAVLRQHSDLIERIWALRP